MRLWGPAGRGCLLKYMFIFCLSVFGGGVPLTRTAFSFWPMSFRGDTDPLVQMLVISRAASQGKQAGGYLIAGQAFPHRLELAVHPWGLSLKWRCGASVGLNLLVFLGRAGFASWLSCAGHAILAAVLNLPEPPLRHEDNLAGIFGLLHSLPEIMHPKRRVQCLASR